MRKIAAFLIGFHLIALEPAALSSQGVARPGGGAPIMTHTLPHLLDVFQAACLDSEADPQKQLAAAQKGRWGFKPDRSFPEQMAGADSVTLSVKPRGGRGRCSVSGLAVAPSSLDDTVVAMRDRLKLGDPVFDVEARTFEVALWGHGTPRTITAISSPQQIKQADGSFVAGPAHVVLSLSYQGSATK